MESVGCSGHTLLGEQGVEGNEEIQVKPGEERVI
jgi:hypothetical protein